MPQHTGTKRNNRYIVNQGQYRMDETNETDAAHYYKTRIYSPNKSSKTDISGFYIDKGSVLCQQMVFLTLNLHIQYSKIPFKHDRVTQFTRYWYSVVLTRAWITYCVFQATFYTAVNGEDTPKHHTHVRLGRQA